MSLLNNNFTNIRTLVNAREQGKYCFYRLFYQCANLIDASKLILPVMIFVGSYAQMFTKCTSLTQAPELPATTIFTKCYYSMFNDCTSLSGSVNLPATNMENFYIYGCYTYMFKNTQISEIHYPVSIMNNEQFKRATGSPWFGATNATIFYDL